MVLFVDRWNLEKPILIHNRRALHLKVVLVGFFWSNRTLRRALLTNDESLWDVFELMLRLCDEVVLLDNDVCVLASGCCVVALRLYF